ncbi:MFS transporter [Cellvibrio fibrivorans]|uniref:UMF1 family MFS transporter n=1 Tax=Cellvibrio fibrivorans TaxID=126350 RepID=A0ABU1UT41_9GAMM|nr:MFS transporter [Cellvibrio fibrivorans]MDR7088353.1 UMF1 family MFS transporter [Cellvibrio fibrivorans]
MNHSELTLPASKKAVRSWMLFDWAAQPFFTVVITFIFGPYFVSRLASDPVVGQAAWGYTITIAGVVIALMAPILGAVADATGARKRWIAFFAAIKIIALLLLWFAAPGSALWLPMLCVIVAMIAAEFSIVFNDSMMPRLIAKEDIGRVSNIAWGLGYLGGLIVLFSVLLLLAGSPETGKTLIGIAPLFGLDAIQGEDARITGPYAALWYLLFILPMFLFTPDTSKGVPLKSAIVESVSELKNTLRELKQRAGLLRFLIARMIYHDGVNGLILLGGTFAAGMFGWHTIEMGIYGILLLVVAIGGCTFAGLLDARMGSKNVILLSLVCLVIATVGIISTGPGYSLFGLVKFSVVDSGGLFATDAEKAFILFGLLIGLAFGPVQASSRSYMARSVSVDEAGRYFGIYALSGRATTFLATMSVTVLTLYTDSARIGMAALIVFLVVGLAILLKAPYPASSSNQPS